MADWQTYLDEHASRFTEDLLDFLRIPSISSLAEHRADVARAADWVAERLRRAGMENVQVLPTGGHPVVYADHLHASGKPTVLIYGHFDTQPVDPLELWDTPPFSPTIREGRVYARGASDDKGNMLAPILALEALLKTTGGLPLNVKVLFEGQEEIGSPQLPEFIAAHKELLRCDLVLSADGSQWEEEQPALWVGLKGICALQIDVTGASSDLHSGGFGGAVQNPIHALVHILATMRGEDGRVRVAGFYDDVRPLSEDDRAAIAAVPFDEEKYKRDLDIPDVFGEAGYSTLERNWARPTLEVNGIWGGFQGDGVKTVLPREAHAKITCRLVADQDPVRVAQLIEEHVKAHAWPGVRVGVRIPETGSKPYLMPADHPGNEVAKSVLEELYGKAPYYVRAGGSIPFCSIILDELGVYTVNFAFALRDEQVHAPNEFFRLSSFERGQQAYARLLGRLAEMTPEALAARGSAA
jgi:acetylornithine deacetylase/succinyl-diaminopimelate desuccinylase-like protein